MKDVRVEMLSKVYNHKGTLVKVDKLDKNEKLVYVTHDNWGYFLAYFSDLNELDFFDEKRWVGHPLLSEK